MTTQEFVAAHKIGIRSSRVSSNPAAPEWKADHWRVTLDRDGETFSLVYSKGYGHKGAKPTVNEVLDCLRSDAWIVENDEFDDLELTYKQSKALEKQISRLREWLDDLWEAFLETEEAA